MRLISLQNNGRRFGIGPATGTTERASICGKHSATKRHSCRAIYLLPRRLGRHCGPPGFALFLSFNIDEWQFVSPVAPNTHPDLTVHRRTNYVVNGVADTFDAFVDPFDGDLWPILVEIQYPQGSTWRDFVLWRFCQTLRRRNATSAACSSRSSASRSKSASP